MSLNSTVISFVPFELNEEKPGLVPPRFKIPASDMKTPSLLKVGTSTHFVYIDQSRGSLPVRNPSDIIAKSIVDDYINSQLGIDEDARPALFWKDEDLEVADVMTRYKSDITKYLHQQKQWFLNVCMIAENDWNRYHQHNVISSFQRKAADIIGWSSSEHEWISPMTTMKSNPCPYCGVSVVDGLPVCSNGHIVDAKKYKELQDKEKLVMTTVK